MFDISILNNYKTGIIALDKNNIDILTLLTRVSKVTAENFNETISDFLKYLHHDHVVEEKYMKEINYPYKEHHMTDHSQIYIHALKIHDISDKFAISATTNRILNHIDWFDRQLTEYITKNNLDTPKFML